MKTLGVFLRIIPILLFYQIGYSQSYSLTLSDPSNNPVTISGLPDVVCNNTSGHVYVPINNCAFLDCIESELDGIPLSGYHVMDRGETLNLTISRTVNVTTNIGIIIDHYTNIGTPNETSNNIFIQGGTNCAPPCTETAFADFTPALGALQDAIVVNVLFVGIYIIPLSVTGPTSLEVPIIESVRTPIVPQTIIYDPPGDGSSSSFTTSTQFCRDYSLSAETSMGFSNNTDVTIGVAGEAGFIVTTAFEFGVTLSGGFGLTKNQTSENTFESCIDISQTFETSTLDSNIGAEADLIIGVSELQYLAIGDVVEIDGCMAVLDKELFLWSDPSQATLSVMTEGLIQQDIVTLQNVVDAGVGASSPIIVTEAQNQIDVWNQVLAQKAANEANATYETSLTFPVGTNIGAEIGFSSTQVSSISYQTVADANIGLEVFFNVGGSGASNQTEITWQDTKGQGTSTTNGTSEIMSYNVTDDEDVIIADVYRDNVFGTPIIRLNPTSATSCPYEGGIRRDQPELSFVSSTSCPSGKVKILEVVDDNIFTPTSEETQVELEVCNNSNESRIYQLSLTGAFNTNAMVTAGGVVLSNVNGVINTPLLSPGECQSVIVNVTGNGGANDAHYLTFLLSPECDGSPEIDEASLAVLDISFEAGATYAANPICTNENWTYVDKSATGNNDGTFWNDAFNYLQDAIDVAVSGDTIVVAAGIYYPDEGMNQTDNDRNASFTMKNGVVILGGFEGTESFDFDVKQRDILNNETILSGDIDQVVDYFGNSYHILYNTNVDNTAVLDGFSITEGSASLSSLNPNGGGMYNDSSSPLIQNCNFSKNTGDSGGAIYNINNSNTTILNCSFLTNYANVNGGAISIAVGSYPSIKYSSFAGNYASANGPAIRIFSTSNLDISHSILWGNGFGTGGTNIDLLSSGASIPCDYCIIDTDGGGNHSGIGTINQNPLFVDQPPTNLNYIGGDLRLQAGSPAIDFIVDPSGPMTDQDGNIRPIGTGHDIGAYEYGDTCPPNHNLTGTLNTTTNYETDGTILSTQTINTGINAIYDSGDCIELNPGFEVVIGAVFEAYIEGCTTPQATNNDNQ